jgi:hypothetical protein
LDARALGRGKGAATYITGLSKTEAAEPERQAAIEALVVELGAPTMFARIDVVCALNRGHVREFNPTQRDPHCLAGIAACSNRAGNSYAGRRAVGFSGSRAAGNGFNYFG